MFLERNIFAYVFLDESRAKYKIIKQELSKKNAKSTINETNEQTHKYSHENGLYTNYRELQLLINNYTLDFITLQETHVTNIDTPPILKNYTGYFHNNPHNKSTKQGTDSLIKDKLAIVKYNAHLEESFPPPK